MRCYNKLEVWVEDDGEPMIYKQADLRSRDLGGAADQLG